MLALGLTTPSLSKHLTFLKLGSMADLVMGAMGSLVPKLLELLKEEYGLQIDAKERIKSLTVELEAAQAALRKVAQVPWDELDEQVKLWAREVRESSYDMEDVLDTYLVHVHHRDDSNKESSWLAKRLGDKMTTLLKKSKARRKISVGVKDIMSHLDEVTARCRRYKVDDIVARPSTASAVDPRLAAMYNKVKNLVGIHKSSDDLISMLQLHHPQRQGQEMKIVSVVGVGGLGKTTLAKAVHDKVKGDFSHWAFVPVGRRNPDLTKVIQAILIELDSQRYMQFHFGLFHHITQFIDELRKFLHEHKRYFIVIDDIWEVHSWETIKLAFDDDNSCGGRVLITTRILDVATKADEVYKLPPLPYARSRELFYSRIGVNSDEVKFVDNNQPDEVSDKILKKCGGIPLAIITMASLLVGKSRERWSEIDKSIGFSNKENRQVDTMKILYFSYYDLPSHLKTCLLYLSVFPEDYVIKKDNLIWKWIAEGFVSEKPGKWLFQVGEEYFNNLINRSMIQSVESEMDGVVQGCRVHDMVLDLICFLSREENFVSIVDEGDQVLPPGNIHRLALHNRNEEHSLGDYMDLIHLRSLNATGCPLYMIPPVSKLIALRVLDLESCGSMEGYDLKHLGKLPHLRFIGLRNTYVRELPEEIGHLKFLQTLDLEGSGVEELPASMGELTQLMCLNADWMTRVPDWIVKLTSLQHLVMYPGGGDGVNSAMFVKDLGNLRELRVLRFWMKAEDEGQLSYFLDSLSALHKIEKIHFACYGVELNNGFMLKSAGFVLSSHIRSLELHGFHFSRLPAWINPQDLPNLRHLWLMVFDVDDQDLEILGGFPELRYLHLLIVSTERGEIVTSCNGAFPSLKFCSITKPLKFQQGAMPVLEFLDFHFNVRLLRDADHDFNFDFGFGNLPSLRQVIVQINCLAAFHVEVETAEAALRHAIEIHPNYPALQIRLKSADRKIMTPQLEKTDDAPNKISNSFKEKGKAASLVESNQTGDLERTSLDSVTEVTGSVILKLGKLLKEEYNFQEDMRKQVDFFSRELQSIHTALCKVANLLPDQLDPQVSIWACEIKEVSHEMEDIIDTFLVPLEECTETPDSDRLKHFLEMMGSLFTKGKALHEIASAIEDLDNQPLHEVAEHHNKTPFHSKSSVRDGVNDPIDEIIRMLLVVDNNADNNKRTKIRHIVRSEGLGETTLAQSLFHKLSPQFDCAAFVQVGQGADMTRVFTDILTGLEYKDIVTSLAELTRMQLIGFVRQTLTGKRFFIVIDDIWDLKAWDIIKAGLIGNSYGSVVLTTARRQNWSGLSWKTSDDEKSHFDGCMLSPPSSAVDLKKLFYERLFGSEDKCLPELKDMSEKFIATCEGMLSVTIETVEVLKRLFTLTEWQEVYDRRKLALSYSDLPDHTRNCLHYFSMFPKDHEISEKRIVWAWIAEGIVQTLQEGESYLNELVKRNIIKAVEVDADGKALSCRAYNFVHDFIVSKSIEANFAAILKDLQDRLPDTVHRVSIQGNTEARTLPKAWLSQAKSLVVSCDTLATISGFQSLCAMDLGGCDSLQANHLKGINYSSLRHLVIGSKCISDIPKEIMKVMKHLQTLDLSASGLNELPESVLQLKKLECLWVSSHMNIPDQIAKMSTLQELGDVNITKPKLLKKLGKLCMLRVLRIAIWSWDDSFKSSVEQLCDNLSSLFVRFKKNIQSFSILTCCSLDFLNGLDDEWAPQSLRKLEIRRSAFDKLPSWFDSLSYISSLTIEVYKLSQDIIGTLERLPALCSLSLASKEVPEPEAYFVIGSDGFEKLKTLKFVSNAMKEMFVPPQEATQQQLEMLTIVFQASRTQDINKDFSFGLDKLCSLEHVRVEIICFNASHWTVKNAESAIRKAISRDGSSHPHLEFLRLEEESMIEKEDVDFR